MTRCTAYRLIIATTLEIPGALPFEGDRPVDVDIAEGPVAPQGKVVGPYRLRADGKLVFEAPGVARYLCSARAIRVERLGGDDSTVSGMLVATALPAVLWMRGEIVLHAAAAIMPGASGAFAIMGRSGSGKSTVLRAMIAAGARIVADDTLCVWRSDAGASGSGLPGGYFHGEPAREFHPVANGIDAAALIGAALLATPRQAGPPEIARLPKLEALTTLIANRHRPRVPLLLGLQPKLMVPLAEVGAALPVHLWKRREGADALEPEEIALLGGTD